MAWVAVTRVHSRRLRFALLFAVLTAHNLSAEDSRASNVSPVSSPEKTTEAAEATDWWHGKWAAGDWGGNREALEKKGVVFEFTYTAEVRDNTAGGINTNHASEYLQNTNASLDFFTEKFGLYSGGEFFVRYEGVLGEGISNEHVGDTQLLSSIDAQPFNQISEFFYRHSILNDTLHFKVGKQDGTGDFLALTYGKDLTHSAYGCISNIPLPRFHNYALAAVVSYDATSWFSFATGVYDGESTGKTTGFDTAFERPFHEFSILELTFKPQLAADLPTIFRVGTWHLRRDIPALGVTPDPGAGPPPVAFRHDLGAYGEFEQLLCGFGKKPEKSSEEDAEKKEDDTAEKPDPSADRGLSIFGQLSWSPDDRNETPRFFGAGIRAKGIFDARDADVVGAGISSVLFAPRLRHLEGKSQESAIEFFYKVQASPFLFFQPDFQYIVKPDGNHRDAVTGGIRFQIAF